MDAERAVDRRQRELLKEAGHDLGADMKLAMVASSISAMWQGAKIEASWVLI